MSRVLSIDEVRVHIKADEYSLTPTGDDACESVSATEYEVVDSEDDYIGSLIDAVQADAENFCMKEFSDDAPENVKLAIKLMVAHHYEFRDAYDKQAYQAAKMSFENLLWPERDLSKLF